MKLSNNVLCMTPPMKPTLLISQAFSANGFPIPVEDYAWFYARWLLLPAQLHGLNSHLLDMPVLAG